MKIFRCVTAFFFACLLFSPAFLSAQAPPTASSLVQENVEELKKSAPRVYIDGDYVDLAYIKTEIVFVNYVRDPKEAQVHILISVLSTGAGGTEYTMTFSGQNEFLGMDDVQKFVSNRTQTSDEIREGIVQVLKMGLMRYVAKTPIGELVGINFKEVVKPTSVVDKWKFWVFSLSANAFLNGQKSTKMNYLNGSFSANRTTPEWKIRTSVNISKSYDSFSYKDTTISSSTTSKGFSGMVVKSLGEHWSIGGYVGASQSTYSNYDFKFSIAPAIEYDFFPYSISTRRQLTALYRLNIISSDYTEETIYNKTSEIIFNESLALTLSLKEKWGSTSIELEGSHYFHDASKNNISVYGSVRLRIIKGLNFNINGTYSMIHDQLSLPKGTATLEEVLLRRTLLETNYSYFISVGLSYTFGSIYSNVVNPRFGGR